MAKKQLKEYKFRPAVVPPPYGQYNNAVTLMTANREYFVAEIMGYMASKYGTPAYHTAAGNKTTYAQALLVANRSFIREEANAYILDAIANGVAPFGGSYFDPTKCKRDLDYILTGVSYDISLGTNYNAVFLGHAESNSLNFTQDVIDVINVSRDQALALPAVASSASAVSTITADYLTINTVAGGTPAPSITFTNPSTATASRVAAKDRLIANKAFIQAEVNSWVASNFPAYNHNVSKCTRDIGYAIDAMCYDLLYGGNSATYVQAKFFFYASAAGSPGIDPTHKAQTISAYTRFQSIVADILTGVAVTKTTTGSDPNTLFQTTSGTNANSGDALTAQSLAQITLDIISVNTQSEANTVLAGYTEVFPSITWASSALQAASNAIILAKTTIKDYSVSTFGGANYYDYTPVKQTKCKRDIGYLIDAFVDDLEGGGNFETYRIARMFYLNGVPQLLNPIQEAATHTFVKDLIANYVLTNTAYTSLQSVSAQVIISGEPGEADAIAKANVLNDIVINLITTGLSSLPAIEYNFDLTWAQRKYGATKCKRDIAYILEAVSYDISLGTNYNALFQGHAESNSKNYTAAVTAIINQAKALVLALPAVSSSAGAIAQVNSDFTEITTLAAAGISATGSALTFTNPSTATTSQIAAKDRLIANKAFLQAEVNAWVGSIYPLHNHSEAKCARDVGYAIDALCYDILYGGNSASYDSAKFFNYAGVVNISDEHLAQTVAAYGRLKVIVGQVVKGVSVTVTTNGTTPNGLTQVTSGTNANQGEATILEGFVQVIADVVANGNSSLPATRTKPSITWATSPLQAASTAIIAASTTIQNTVVTYNDYTYNASKCQRDSYYIYDAYLYDMTYGGNSSSYYVAGQYQIKNIPQVVFPDVEVEVQTFARDVIINYILMNKYHASYQWTEYQIVNTSLNIEAAADNQVTYLSDIIIDCIGGGLSTLPAPVAPDNQGGNLMSGAVALLEANKKFIQEEAIAYIQYGIDNNIIPFVYYTYNSAKCRRDISYVLEGYLSDMRQGGNKQSVFNASKYFEGGVAQVDGNRLPEVYTHTFIRDLIENFIWTNTPYTPKQILASQSLDQNAVIETFADSRLKELSNSIINVIQYGLDYLPTEVSNRGYIKVLGFYKLKDFLLVTNSSRNIILYNFADPLTAAEATYSEDYDADYPGALYGTDKITTLTFSVNTSNMMVTDSIQIFVENKEGQQVRLNPIATDAMERMKVGIPQSMLDADFEYGLQPTKWQALALLRNYPAIYEIPGSDLSVISVTTDASTGTGGAGSSSITVTTVASHGFAVGDAITIKALANTINGFSRAEGSFLVATVPTLNTFTFWAKSKVGTSPGQVLATNYTQLRKGQFYTNASVGSPAFTVYSSGSSGTITTSLITPTGATTVGFTGSPPPIGSPISGTGVNTGTQVTAVTGSGGIAATTKLATVGSISDTSLTVLSTTGLSQGLIFNRGDGQAVIVTGVSGNTVTLSGPLTSVIKGNAESFAAVTGTTSGGGSLGVFTVSRSGNAYTTTITTPGGGYAVNDTITILGSALGGVNSTNDAVITVATASSLNSVASVGSLNAGTGGWVSGSTLGVATTRVLGSGASVDIVVDGVGDILSVAVNSGGNNYRIGDILTINDGSGHNTATVTVSTISAFGAILTFTGTIGNGTGTAYLTGTAYNLVNSTTASGTGLTVDIIADGGGLVTSVNINTTGTGYKVYDRILLTGGASDTTIQVASVTPGGLITSVTTAGTPITAPDVNFVSAFTISEATTADIANGNTGLTYSSIATIQVTFPSNHGFVPGNTITVQITSAGVGAQLAAGAYFVEQVPTSTTFRYTARAAGTIDNTLVGNVYARPDSFFVHRPFDGGVQLGTASPSHSATAIRMSKKYIRYQSGKGVMYNTGALFAPSYDLRSLTANGTAVGSVITINTDDTDHGCQIGGVVIIEGVETAGYNGEYTVINILNERSFQVLSQKILGSTTAAIGSPCYMSVRRWHGSTVRSGIFDDQNGMFYQYDGIRMAVVRRSSTFQIAGTITIVPNGNLVTGSNTRFTAQLAQGDRIVIRGMTHIVSKIDSDTILTVTPDYRGVVAVDGAKTAKTIDTIVAQENWNQDTMNGAGPSGYNLDVTKMQMIGIQHTWYGAGFIDFMLRGPEGNYTFAHRYRNSNVNTEAYMRTGNQPVRYEVINEGAKGRLRLAMDTTQTTIPLFSEDAYWFPDSGVVYVDNELIRYTGRTETALTGCVRSASLTQFVAGSQRNFTAGPATSHALYAGVCLVSNTITPNISHWGSAFMIDGQFDSDRGYIFNYAATALTASVDKSTAFLIRLAPSVSNAIIGDLGEKELLNRAQLLLSSVSITSDTGGSTGAIVVEGVLNPSNYPTDPTKITWTGLASSAAGGQPSFAQIASGGSVTWSGNVSTSTATVNGALTTTLTAKSFNLITATLTATSFSAVTQNITIRSFAPASNATYTTALNIGRTDFLVLQSDLDALNNSGTTVQATDTLTVVGNGTAITGLRILDLAGSVQFTNPGITLYVGETITISGVISNTSTTLNNVQIVGASGQFTCNAAGTTLLTGQRIIVTNAVTPAAITGYTAGPTAYLISATNGTTTFTLTETNGTPLTTTAGATGTATFVVQPPSITGYTSGTQYRILTTNGSTTATLTTLAGAALVTSGGTPTGITNSLNSLLNSSTISSITPSFISILGTPYARIVMASAPNNSSGTAATDGQFNVTLRITSSLSARYSNAISNARTDFLITQTQYAATTIAVADVLSATTFIVGGQTVSGSTANYVRINNVVYAQIVMTGNGSASSTAGTGNNVTVTITNSISNTYNRALSTARLDFLITDADYDASKIELSDILSVATYFTAGQTVQTITRSYLNISGTNYTRIVTSAVPNASSNANAGNDITVTVTAAGTAASYNRTNYLYFTQASWLSSGATQGTKIASSYTQFPAGTAVTVVATRSLGATTIYRITFTQTSNTTISAAATPTFQFGAQYALPGEQVFSFIANPGESGELSLETLKELTATAIGGRGTFPNGPDVLAINIYKVSGTAVTSNLILRWGEAQA